MNGQYLTSIGFKSIRQNLFLRCSLFNQIYLVAKDLLKLKNLIKSCLQARSYSEIDCC